MHSKKKQWEQIPADTIDGYNVQSQNICVSVFINGVGVFCWSD